MIARPTPRLVPDSPTLSAIEAPGRNVTELRRHVPQGGHHPELAEARGERHEGHGEDRAVVPPVQPQPAGGIGRLPSGERRHLG